VSSQPATSAAAQPRARRRVLSVKIDSRDAVTPAMLPPVAGRRASAACVRIVRRPLSPSACPSSRGRSIASSTSSQPPEPNHFLRRAPRPILEITSRGARSLNLGSSASRLISSGSRRAGGFRARHGRAVRGRWYRGRVLSLHVLLRFSCPERLTGARNFPCGMDSLVRMYGALVSGSAQPVRRHGSHIEIRFERNSFEGE